MASHILRCVVLVSFLLSLVSVALCDVSVQGGAVPPSGGEDISAGLMSDGIGLEGKEEDPAQVLEELKTMLGMDASEMKRRSDIVFDYIDRDRNGKLSQEELHSWIAKVKDAVHQKQVAVEMQTIDKDGDGKVTFEEMKAAYADSDGGASNEDTLTELRKRFAAVDKDHDGALSLAEIGLLMNPGMDEELMTLELEEILTAQDKDKDRRISLDEFLMSDDSVAPDEMEQYKSEFDTYDTDKNGFIDEAEIRKVVAEPHQQEVNDAVIEVQKLGVNGELSKAYWSEKFHKFVISGATDNGELLRYPKEYNLGLPFDDVPKPKDEEEEAEHEEL
eukprot:GHVS01059627.1.p1 GENE.GHVS01059627.1~~GHVS01059627.1.p1  ORF type:complete len:332 (+),score=77.61 GHVS01059627.1:263-1258(+)